MRSLLLCLSLALTLTAQTPVTVIKAARMFDGKGDHIIEPGLIVISGGRIQSVGGTAPAGAKVIDLGDATLLPGFIDSHTHLTMDFDLDYNAARLKALGPHHRRERHPRHRQCAQDSDGRIHYRPRRRL
jgi:formylmethanofuran dehydrogenase subunit A